MMIKLFSEPKILFFAVMCVLICVQMPVYSHYKVQGKGRAYTLSKCAGSLIFVLTALGSLLFACVDTYSILIIIAMVLSAVGDYILACPEAHRLKIGGAVFGLAHVFFTAAFICAAGFNWLIIPIVAAVFALELYLAKVFNLKNRGAGASMAVYILTVTTMAVCSVFMLASSELRVSMSPASDWMTACGAVLFLVSDCFWMSYGMVFNKSKAWLKVANVLTYFPAQILIAGALLFR